MTELSWIIPMLPLTGAVVVFLLGKRVNRWSGWITSIMVFLALMIGTKIFSYFLVHPDIKHVSITWLKTAGQLQLDFGILLDPLSVLMLVIVLLVSFMVHIYSMGYMADDPNRSRYFAFLSLFTFSMLGLVLADNLILLYMFWELVGLSSYLLIGFWNHKPEAANAAKKAFIVTRFGDLGFLVALLLLGLTLNQFNILDLGRAVNSGQLSGPVVTALALLIFAGAAGKSAQFPLHIWLPDAMEGPTPVSALIHAATMVAAGIFLVARVFPLFEASATAMTVVATVGGITAFFAATIACVQNDIKRILAYSTLSQLGYMMMAMGCGGYAAGMFHLTTHAAFKALLFLAAGAVIHAVHTNNIWEMGGLGKRMKITGLTMGVAGLALAGVPPLSGFFSKDVVLMASYNAHRLDLLVVGLITALLTSFYIARLFFVVFTGPEQNHGSHEAPLVMTIPLMILAALTVGLGFFGKGLEHFLQFSFGAPQPNGEAHTRVVPMLAFLAAIMGMGWAYLVYAQKAVSAALLQRRFAGLHSLLTHKYYIDEIYMFLVRRVLWVVASGLAWFDRHVVDGAVNGVAWICQQMGQGLRVLQSGRLHAYMLVFILGVLVLLVSLLVNHPQVMAAVAGIMH